MNRTEILCKVMWNSHSVPHPQLTGAKAQDSAAGFACLCPTQYPESKFKGHSSLDHEPRADHSWKRLPQTLKCPVTWQEEPHHPLPPGSAQTRLACKKNYQSSFYKSNAGEENITKENHSRD